MHPSPRTSHDVSLSPAVDPSPTAAADASRPCAWCRGEISATARRDAKFCRQSCRQASHRFGRGMRRAVAAGEPLRVAYADPPYPGKAHLYRGHPDFAGEVDHRALLERLADEFPDGWALSTSAAALPEVLALCPPGVRVAAWVRGERPNAGALVPLSSWEPVLFHGGRAKLSPVDARRVDSLVYRPGTRTTDPDRVIGAKPAAFIWWLFELLGLEPHDDLVDLFPGSGGVGRAWAMFTDPSRLQGPDPSPGHAGDPSLDVDHDPSLFTVVDG